MTQHPNYRVSVEIILRHNHKVLLTKRSNEATVAPGVWNVPAGKVKYLELPVDAARREVKEETNIIVDELKEIHVRTFEGSTATESIYRLIFTYLADTNNAQLADFQLNDEHSEFAWASEDEISQSQFDSLFPAFRDILIDKAFNTPS